MDIVIPTDADIRAAWQAASVSPLWEDAAAHGGGRRGHVAHSWPWSTMEPLVNQALSLASTEVIERRVLSMINPSPRFNGDRAFIGSINAALQILKPGEIARPHRHTMNAIRFVLQGSGASTIVDGKDCPMEPGDLVTTPGWTWHEHVHHGNEPIIWLDALDVPIHALLGTGRFEPGPIKVMPVTTPDAAFAQAGVVPDGVSHASGYSPVFRYPYGAAVAALAAAPTAPDGSRRVRYVDPTHGGPTLAMLDCFMVELDGVDTIPFRSSSSAVCCVVEGTGSTEVGDSTIAWAPKDVFTLTPNSWIRHRSKGRARLFLVTDRDLLRRLDLLTDEYQTSI